MTNKCCSECPCPCNNRQDRTGGTLSSGNMPDAEQFNEEITAASTPTGQRVTRVSFNDDRSFTTTLTLNEMLLFRRRLQVIEMHLQRLEEKIADSRSSLKRTSTPITSPKTVPLSSSRPAVAGGGTRVGFSSQQPSSSSSFSSLLRTLRRDVLSAVEEQFDRLQFH